VTNASQEERARIIREERTLNTRSALQQVLDPILAGRFAKEAKADFTVGRDEAVHYPRLPSGPWSGPQPPPEEPLGFSVEEMPVMGEPFEVERAANLLAERAEAAELAVAAAGPLPCGSADASLSTVGLANSAPFAAELPPGDGAAFHSSTGLGPGPALATSPSSAAMSVGRPLPAGEAVAKSTPFRRRFG
jgi:hypothetical protein